MTFTKPPVYQISPFFSLGSPGSLDHQQRFSNSPWLAFIKPPVNQISPFFSLGSPGSLDHQSLAEKKCGDPQPWLTFTFSSAMDFNFLILKTYYWFMHQKVVILPWYVLWYHYSPSRIFVYHLKQKRFDHFKILCSQVEWALSNQQVKRVGLPKLLHVAIFSCIQEGLTDRRVGKGEANLCW